MAIITSTISAVAGAILNGFPMILQLIAVLFRCVFFAVTLSAPYLYAAVLFLLQVAAAIGNAVVLSTPIVFQFLGACITSIAVTLMGILPLALFLTSLVAAYILFF